MSRRAGGGRMCGHASGALLAGPIMRCLYELHRDRSIERDARRATGIRGPEVNLTQPSAAR